MCKPGIFIIVVVVIIYALAPGECHTWASPVESTNQTIRVPDDYDTIQEAIDAADPAVIDEIIVADGTYTGPGNRDIDFRGKALTLRSENGPQNCKIDCQYQPVSVFRFESGEGPDSVLDGFQIVHSCHDDNGGGIYCSGSSPTIQNCDISFHTLRSPDEMSASDGGGIYCYGGSPIIQNCIISNNTFEYNGLLANGSGAGIACRGSNPTIRNCIVRGNNLRDFGYGGGILLSGCIAEITDCHIYRNGLNAVQDPFARGLGVCIINSDCVIRNCRFEENEQGEWEMTVCDGGGLYIIGGNTIIDHCVFLNNYTYTGGALVLIGGVLKVTNCVVFGNVTDWSESSGMDIRDSNFMMSNSVIWGNSPPGSKFSGSTVTYSDVQNGTGQSWFGTGCIDVDPQFVDAANGDFHLKSRIGRWDSNSQTWV